MKHFAYIISLFCFSSLSWAQLPTTTFEPPNCNYDIDYNYTYSNAFGGYKIFRNGVEIYKADFSYPISKSCLDLKFISNSTGFKVTTFSGNATPYLIVEKTSNYGTTWSFVGMTYVPYVDFYIINEHLGYLVTSGALNSLKIVRCSDIEQPTNTNPNQLVVSPYFISLGSVAGGQTVIKNDVIPGNSICPEDSIVVECFGNGTNDTNKAVINLSYREYKDNRPNESFYFFPNPTKTYLHINNIHFKQIDVVNLQGKIVKTFYGNTHELKVDDLANGIYVLRILDLYDNSYYSKFIKQDNGL